MEPYLSYPPDLLIFKHHFRLSQSLDPKVIRITTTVLKAAEENASRQDDIDRKDCTGGNCTFLYENYVE